MNRSNLYRAAYAAAGLAACGMIALIYAEYDIGAAAVVAISLVFLVRISAYVQRQLWHDHFEARIVFAFRKWEESISYSARFIQKIQSTPFLRHAVWLNYMVHTRDIEAATLNNLASAQMALGRFSEAHQALDEALRRDPIYPMPFLNRAKILLFHNQNDKALDSFMRARSLGYYGCTWNQLLKEMKDNENGA